MKSSNRSDQHDDGCHNDIWYSKASLRSLNQVFFTVFVILFNSLVFQYYSKLIQPNISPMIHYDSSKCKRGKDCFCSSVFLFLPSGTLKGKISFFNYSFRIAVFFPFLKLFRIPSMFSMTLETHSIPQTWSWLLQIRSLDRNDLDDDSELIVTHFVIISRVHRGMLHNCID